MAARELAPPWRRHVGLLPVGWGLFNLVEGTVNHILLGIHHVGEGQEETPWDLAISGTRGRATRAGALLAHRRSGDRLLGKRPIGERSPG